MINKEVSNENQVFYSKDGIKWKSALDGIRWEDSEVSDYLHKHLSWNEYQAIVNPPKSSDEMFNIELDELNKIKDEKISSLVIDYSYAVAVDGSTETEKVTSIRDEMTVVNDQYAADQLALINKYYGE